MIWGVQKKVSRGNFRHDPDYLQWIFFCNRNYRQNTISQQILETFGQCQNCQYQTFKWLYQLYKAILEKYFFVKRFTMMLLYMYQIFSSLRSHLHFFVHFFFTLMEYFFFWTPHIYNFGPFKSSLSVKNGAIRHRWKHFG